MGTFVTLTANISRTVSDKQLKPFLLYSTLRVIFEPIIKRGPIRSPITNVFIIQIVKFNLEYKLYVCSISTVRVIAVFIRLFLNLPNLQN